MPKTVAEVLLIVGVQVQLSLLAIYLPLDEFGVSTLAPFKDPRLYQGTGMTLKGVKKMKYSNPQCLKIYQRHMH